jgi:hypothetical protein
MLKTIVVALITFLGLKVGSPIYKLLQTTCVILFWSILVLIVIKYTVPFVMWYINRIVTILNPIVSINQLIPSEIWVGLLSIIAIFLTFWGAKNV